MNDDTRQMKISPETRRSKQKPGRNVPGFVLFQESYLTLSNLLFMFTLLIFNGAL